MLALAEYEAGVCDCGFHESVIDPKTLHVTFEDRICPVCAGATQYRRYLDDRDDEFTKGLGKEAPPRTPRPSDGRRTFIKPVPPPAEKTPKK